MCRLFGITNFQFEAHRDLIVSFCQLAVTGTVMKGDPPGHQDGWGLAYYVDGKAELLKSGASLSDQSDQVMDALSRAGASPVVILHLRKSAWKNSSCTRHAHPFAYGNAVFAHNGVVHDYKELLPEISVAGLKEDALDTEVFFYHVLSQQKASLGDDFLASIATIKEKGYRFSALNCLLSDGAALYAYRDYSKEPDYYSLYKAQSAGSCVICSEPLDNSLTWDMMHKEEFFVARY